jgi:hypothetical protein
LAVPVKVTEAPTLIGVVEAEAGLSAGAVVKVGALFLIRTVVVAESVLCASASETPILRPTLSPTFSRPILKLKTKPAIDKLNNVSIKKAGKEFIKFFFIIFGMGIYIKIYL